MNFGATIRQCRKLRKMTQAQLAKDAGLSVSHLCLLEKDKREPSIGAVESIATALKIPMSILVFLASEQEKISELNIEHINKLKALIKELTKDGKN